MKTNMNISETVLGYIQVATISPKVYPGEVKKNVEIHKQAILDLLREDSNIKLIILSELSLTRYTPRNKNVGRKIYSQIWKSIIQTFLSL